MHWLGYSVMLQGDRRENYRAIMLGIPFRGKISSTLSTPLCQPRLSFLSIFCPLVRLAGKERKAKREAELKSSKASKKEVEAELSRLAQEASLEEHRLEVH